MSNPFAALGDSSSSSDDDDDRESVATTLSKAAVARRSAAATPTKKSNAASPPQQVPSQWEAGSFWDLIGSPTYVCAPMVWQSERAFRILVRQHGVGLCYTPMINAHVLIKERRMAGASHLEGAYDGDIETVLSDLVEGYVKQEPPPPATEEAEEDGDAVGDGATGVPGASRGASTDTTVGAEGAEGPQLNSAARRKLVRAAKKVAAEEAAAAEAAAELIRLQEQGSDGDDDPEEEEEKEEKEKDDDEGGDDSWNVVVKGGKAVLEIEAKTDRPLIAQFCATTPDALVEAAKLVEPFVDAIDLNLGCPQKSAKTGGFGAYLMDRPKQVEAIIRSTCAAVSVPVTAKIRVFANVKKTVDFAKMLERAGCAAITVHGRTREQRHHEGKVRWKIIKAVVDAVNIPVIANGGVDTLAGAEKLRHDTGAAAVMVATGLLTNFRMFTGEEPNIWRDAWDYIEQARITPTPSIRFVKDHLLGLFGNYRSGLLKDHPDIYDLMNRNTAVTDLEQLYHLTRLLGSRYGRVLPPPRAAGGGDSGSGTLVHESAQGSGGDGEGDGEGDACQEDPWAIKPLFSPRQIKLNKFQPKKPKVVAEAAELVEVAAVEVAAVEVAAVDVAAVDVAAVDVAAVDVAAVEVVEVEVAEVELK